MNNEERSTSVLLKGSNYLLLKPSPDVKIESLLFKEPLMQVCEANVIWIRNNFFCQSHRSSYFALESPIGPIVISYALSGQKYKIIVCTPYGCERFSLDSMEVPVPFWRKILGFGPHVNRLLAAINYKIPEKSLKRCRNQDVPKAVLEIEEKQIIRSYKFGVLYAAPGQTTENEILSNRIGSPAFDKFLSFLGQKINLKTWNLYRAGLDVSGMGLTGYTSVYTKWQEYEIMFHVSTMLPYSEWDPQQIERKRHIGNDIVIIIFQDDKSSLIDISSFVSRQNHIIFVVHPTTNNSYEFVILFKKDVNITDSNLNLPDPPIIRNDSASRDFFISKLIYGERASYNSSEFAPKILRTRAILLTELVNSYC